MPNMNAGILKYLTRLFRAEKDADSVLFARRVALMKLLGGSIALLLILPRAVPVLATEELPVHFQWLYFAMLLIAIAVLILMVVSEWGAQQTSLRVIETGNTPGSPRSRSGFRSSGKVARKNDKDPTKPSSPDTLLEKKAKFTNVASGSYFVHCAIDEETKEVMQIIYPGVTLKSSKNDQVA